MGASPCRSGGITNRLLETDMSDLRPYKKIEALATGVE
jgi:hypothetical protein